MSETRKNILFGVKWNAIGQIGRQLITFFLMIVLTRILSPVEFGQIGILLVFIGISDVFINSGLSTALIQQKSKSTIDYSTVFLFNLCTSLFFYCGLYFAAPTIAGYFEQPELTVLCRILSIVFVINAFGTIQSTILTIDLNFKKQNIISILGVIVSAVVSLVMALNNYKVYSLVGQLLAFSLTTNLMLWFTSKWRPQLVFSMAAFKRLFKFGSNVLVSSLLNTFFTSVDNLIVGKSFSTIQLGYYTRAKSTSDLLALNTTGILSSVFFPVFSKITDRDELIRLHKKFLGILAYMIFPIMIGLSIVAEPLTLLLFGEEWIPSSSMLQVVALYGLLYPLSVILVQTLLVIGESRRFLNLDIYKKSVLLIVMSIGMFSDLKTFLILLCTGHYIGFAINLLFLSRSLNITILDYLKCFVPSILVTSVMSLIVISIGFIEFASPIYLLSAQVIAGIISYISISFLFRIEDFFYLKNLVLRKFQP